MRSASTGPEQLEGLGQQRHEQVVAVGGEVEGGVAAGAVGGPVALGRAPGPGGGGALQADLEVAAGGEPVEVVAGHVRVHREGGGHLRGGGAGVGAHVEVDLAPGGVAEGRGDGGHGGGEPAVGGAAPTGIGARIAHH